MEYDIGSKIQAARLEKNMTQEQVAGLLEVSRQTISNWENAKSYPDIVSVIKMSECYDVSLDYLLKGEQNSYYLMIWTVSMLVFWVFKGGIDAMGYSLMFLWIIIPVTTFTVSVIIGKNNFWGIKKWAFTFPFGVMYMLAEYGTFSMANNIAFNKINELEWDLAVAGAIISAIGMLTGLLINWICRNRNKIARIKQSAVNIFN